NRPSFACLDPFTIVALRPGQGLRRLLECLHLRIGNHFGIGAVEAAQDGASVAYEEEPFVVAAAHLPSVLKLDGPRRAEAAVVHGQLDRRHIALLREAVGDYPGLWIGLCIHFGGAGLDALGRPEFEHSKDRVETVAAHIAYGATAKVKPAAPDKRQIDMV